MNFNMPGSSKISIGILLILISVYSANGQILKSIVYDFDGIDLFQTNLPDGDYLVNDLTYQVDSNPLSSNDMLGDRVLKLNLNWNTGNGTFGKGISRFIEFDPDQDKFNFYFYNPLSNYQEAKLELVITDDDDKSYTYDNSSDDCWKKSILIPGSSNWQFISVPLNDFIDSNLGGNGIFDIGFESAKGMLLQVEFRFTKSSFDLNDVVFYIDMINFSEGNLPRGASDFDLPNKALSDYCLLGAYNPENISEAHLIPTHVERLFPIAPEKKLKYANLFLQFAMDSSTLAKALPGNEVQRLINNGYTPIITWEPRFQGFDLLDSVQPKLNNIINGDYDIYIDDFANKIKTYTDTVIIRFMHEFNGNWYPWSLSQNNQDPARYITAYRKVVDHFRSRGVTNVKWMWCVNSDYFPFLSYNWFVPAYPGDNYVDIVATDIYNNIYPVDLPFWESFSFQAAESYYYLTKYFPQKPLFVCEFGCRERFNTENSFSQNKGAWFARMDKELQSNYHKVRALVFFNGVTEQNWVINSSATSLQSIKDNIWDDEYYFENSNTLNGLRVDIAKPSKELISAGSSWKYLDNGTNQGTEWRAPSFNDATWKIGNAEFCYGDGGEATVVSYGPSSTNKYITTYFRKAFTVTDISTISGLELGLIRDDGAVVYINGVEVYRNNLPSGTIFYNTLAPTIIDATKESIYIIVNISSSSLVNGTNHIAVEIHQNAKTSPDMSFNLKLKTLSGSRIMENEMTNDTTQENAILENKVEMIVYPNPNTGQFNLEFCIDELNEKIIMIEISNSFGQVIYKKIPQKIKGCIKETIELEASIPIGVYIMKVTIDDKIQTAKMLLTR
ncbi:MAG: glycosyl hydrolase [Bacteroidota bacterium]|nr:glycosyl hydrolase [Bacteroidota bacterium]